ncbi:MAG: hypothetical protein OEW97_03520 [Gammaproteobacteria bacterium]|nr:hypothetical protein [Gammaproteobacteria bacterium]
MKASSFFIGAMLCACIAPASFAAKQNGFNPDISLVLDGRYGSYKNSSDYALPGFMLGGEASRGNQGYHLGHNELSLSANIDDLFYGKLTTAIADHEGATEVELEEAFIETQALGNGVAVKAGRFFSDLGYLNNQHGHAWDFMDAPLVYRGLFGDQMVDDGVQLSWLAPTETYFKVGVEGLRGERYPSGGAAKAGRGSNIIFAKFGGDAGVSHAWQLGFSHWSADINGRAASVHSHGGTKETPTFYGKSKVNAIDIVWKWSPNGNSRERNLKIQAEYFERDESGRIDMVNSSPLETSTYSGKQSGMYAQAIYQFMPRWRIGYRYDELKANNSGSDSAVLGEAGLNVEGHTPKRSTLMLDYSHSEYSRIRFQYAKDDSYSDSDDLFFVQYIVTLGAHGAHSF